MAANNGGAMTTFKGGVPAVLQKLGTEADDLSAGISGGFAVMSFRASKWRVKYQGEETPLLNSNGDPIPSLEVVVLKANPHITKQWYAEGYAEGDAKAPDCYSLDGKRPDVGSPKKQSQTCASCPQNVFGSRMTPAGKKAKACSDNRRLAIVPVADIQNDTFGGPMLLRVPAGSLAELAMMGKNLKQRGFPYNAVAIRIGFDINASYPKLTFKPIRPLSEDEGQAVVEMLAGPNGDKLERILAEAVELLEETPAPTAAVATPVATPAPTPKPAADPLFEQPVAAKPAAKPKAAKPAAAAPAAVIPQNDLEGQPQLDKDISDILGELGDMG